jgi:hypothetical protein
LGEQVELAPQVVERLMITPDPVSSAERIPETYLQVRDYFSEHQALIEARLVQELMPLGVAADSLAVANRGLGLSIKAALALGDMGFLDAEIAWMEGLLRNRSLPTAMLHRYFQAYYRLAREQLDERGEPIVAWLATILQGTNRET